MVQIFHILPTELQMCVDCTGRHRLLLHFSRWVPSIGSGWNELLLYAKFLVFKKELYKFNNLLLLWKHLGHVSHFHRNMVCCTRGNDDEFNPLLLANLCFFLKLQICQDYPILRSFERCSSTCKVQWVTVISIQANWVVESPFESLFLLASGSLINSNTLLWYVS